ncbi:MoeB/ThiF family adenylyltransferase [Virgibacillus xinjiangensis]|uniref:MoeB/ThiF family adenylyltransferase n=1 Tax=Virgibacillus xinjiangensis TaxID=393090 RepID=A0ABV7CWY5_9BACI
MTDRYSRQTLFQPIGETGQQRISQKHVLILGCGALGSANAENLVRAGVGKLTLIDRDYVEVSNLQRQQLFTTSDANEQLPKVVAAKARLQEINPGTEIEGHVMDATSMSLEPLIKKADLAIDATDNFDIRFILNDVCQKLGVPWIYGSCVGSTGMSYTVLPDEGPCLQCLLDTVPVTGATCDSVGIISPAVQMVVAHQSAEALKLLVEDKEALRAKLVTFDLWRNHYQTIGVGRAKNESCPSCGESAVYPYLTYEAQTKTEVLCGRNTVQIRPNRKVSLEELSGRLERIAPVKSNSFLLSMEYDSCRLVFFHDGRALVHGTNSIEKAKNIYYKLIG